MIQHMRAKCVKHKKEFLITLEKVYDNWYMVSATPIEKSSGGGTGFGGTLSFKSGGLYAKDSYSCPLCGNKNLYRCSCGNISCDKGKLKAKCAYCGKASKPTVGITSVNTEQSGGKFKG